LFRPQERAFKQFKCPRPQRVKKKFVTLYGHMNIKFVKMAVCSDTNTIKESWMFWNYTSQK